MRILLLLLLSISSTSLAKTFFQDKGCWQLNAKSFKLEKDKLTVKIHLGTHDETLLSINLDERNFKIPLGIWIRIHVKNLTTGEASKISLLGISKTLRILELNYSEAAAANKTWVPLKDSDCL